MIRLELEPYEQKDIIEYLNYALNQKERNKNNRNSEIWGMKFDTTQYDIKRIRQLIEIVKEARPKTNLSKNSIMDDYIENQKIKQRRYEKEKEEIIKIL